MSEAGPPPGTVWIDPEVGYLPHFADAFLDAYGADSRFVLAVADCLFDRHVNVLIRAGKMPPDTLPMRIGTPRAFDAMVLLMRTLTSRGVERSVVQLMQVALGSRDHRAFSSVVDETFGEGVFERWRQAFERGEFEHAAACIGVQ